MSVTLHHESKRRPVDVRYLARIHFGSQAYSLVDVRWDPVNQERKHFMKAVRTTKVIVAERLTSRIGNPPRLIPRRAFAPETDFL